MADSTPLRVRFDAFELDEANARLTRDGHAVSLPPKAFAVLCELTRRQGQLVTKNALLDAVWGHQHVSESLLKNIISLVRAALADDAKSPRYIETASRFGYRFIAKAPSVPAIPTPQARRAGFASTLIGREAALAKMRTVWQKVLAGERQLILISGEAGIGKTMLIEHFVRELGPGVAASGHCVEHFGSGEPYLPVLEVVKELCRMKPELIPLMRTVAPTWLMQMPWLVTEPERAALHRELAGAHPDRMLREIRELMNHFSANRPVCLIFEDMHWSDLATLRLMEHFARRAQMPPILWIASFRLTQVIADEHPLRGLRQELRAQRLCEEITLDPFSESDVAAYVRGHLPDAEIPDSFVRRLHAHTDGLPLFVANVTDALATERWQATSAGPLPVPESLAGVIEKQAATLPADVQALLEAASVCGTEFRAGVVADMIERDAQWVRDRCDGLVRRQLWLRQVGIVELPNGGFDSRFSFLHALYHHVLYDRLTLSQRVDHHRRAAQSLSTNKVVGETVPPVELASHYERGHSIPAAVRAYAEAAGLALAHFAPKDSAALSAHGLSLLERCPAGDERLELELSLAGHSGLAASQLQGVASDEARAAFARVQALSRQLPATPARAAILNGLGWIFIARGDFDDALALAAHVEEIATRYNDIGLQIFAWDVRGVALVHMGQLVSGCEVLERGIDACLALGDDRVAQAEFLIDPEVSMRMNLSFPLVNRGLADQARSHFALGSERARKLREPMSLALMHWAAGYMAVRLDEPADAKQEAAELARLHESTMLAQGQGPSLWLRGLGEARLGEPLLGHRHILEGYACHARFGMYAGCTEVLGYAAEALILAGDWQGARSQLDEAFALARRIGEQLSMPELFLLEARIALGEKDRAKARASIMEAVREAQTQEAHGSELRALVALAELDKPRREDLAALDAAYSRITEGFDTNLYRRAGKLLSAHGKSR